MRAVITVIGKDMVGILAKVSTCCAGCNANVVEVTQSVLQELFAMIMLVDITNLNCDFSQLVNSLKELGEGIAFRSMSCMRMFLIPCTEFKS